MIMGEGERVGGEGWWFVLSVERRETEVRGEQSFEVKREGKIGRPVV